MCSPSRATPLFQITDNQLVVWCGAIRYLKNDTPRDTPLLARPFSAYFSTMEHLIQAFRNYANFSGRATRSEYWSFQVIGFIIGVATAQQDVLAHTWNDELSIGLFSGLWFLASIVPYLSILSRRLHDVGKSGWMGLLLLLPIIGWIWVTILLFQPSISSTHSEV